VLRRGVANSGVDSEHRLVELVAERLVAVAPQTLADGLHDLVLERTLHHAHDHAAKRE
jgi:hypothetical protein